MNATVNVRTRGCGVVDRTRRAAALLALAALLAGSQAAAQEQKAAVLKLQEFDFSYRSSVAHFSCGALQARVASILRALGARDDVNVTANGCDFIASQPEPAATWETPSSRGGISASRWGVPSSRAGARNATNQQHTIVRIRAMMPVEVTPEVLAEMDRDKSRRDLISRVTGNPAASLNDPIVFPAQRQPVTLSRRTVGLEPEDCELLEQMSTSVFRELGMRLVRRGPGCARNEVSRFSPQMTVEALMPVMPQTPQVAPAPGSSASDPGEPPAAAGTGASEPATGAPPEPPEPPEPQE
jgi:hypothetical protein